MSNAEANLTDGGLREGVMSGPELAAQAVASIAPSAVIAFTAAEIFAGSGRSTVYAFVIAVVVILCVGYIISMFARLFPSAGSLYTYVSKALGPLGAFIAGVALLIGSWGVVTGALSGAVGFFMDLLRVIDMPVVGLGWRIVITIALGALATFLTMWGIRTSARISFTLELFSIGVILVLLVTALVWAGKAGWDPGQFSLSGIPFQNVAGGAVIGFMGFVGFSSADALGREAKNPKTAIPRAIMWSALGVGLLYVFAAYTQIAILGDRLAEVESPLEALVEISGMPTWYSIVVVFGVVASFFAVTGAALNVVGRILYVMGKEGVAPAAFGRTHDRLLTPHRALTLGGVTAIIVAIILAFLDVGPVDALVHMASYGTYGYMLAYALVSIAGVVYTRRVGVKAPMITVTATIAVISIAYVFFANLYPVPEFPSNILPYLFILTLAFAMTRYFYLRKNDPETLQRIGNTHTEMMEGV